MSNLVIRKDIELKSGWEWIKSAFYIFRESPVQFVLLGIINVIFSILPLFGSFMAPLFTARFAYLANKVESGEKIQMSMLFNGMFANLTLLRLSFFNFTLSAIYLIGQYFLETYFKAQGQAESIGATVSLLVFLIPILILQVAMWISPIICLNNPEIRPVSAMAMSIKVGLYNVVTLILYSLLVLVFSLLAILPVGLGLLIWLPVMNIASYYVYKSAIKIN